MTERASVSYRAVFWALVVSLALSLSFGAFVYYRFIRFEPRASLHAAPQDGALFVRLDVEQAVVYEPFRRHILSLLEAGRVSKEPRLLHIERKTSLELGVDARELAVSFTGDDVCLVAVGGLFRRDRVVSGIREMLEEEGLGATVGEEPTHVVGPRGRALGVTEDGVLLLAPNASAFRLAFPARGEFQRQPGTVLSFQTGRAFVPYEVDGARLRAFAGRVEVGRAPGVDFEWSGDFEGEGNWTEDRVRALLSAAGWDRGTVGEGLKIQPISDGKFRVSGNLSRERFDRVVARLGGALGACIGLP